MVFNLLAFYRLQRMKSLMRGFRYALKNKKIEDIRVLESKLGCQQVEFVSGLIERKVFGSLWPRAEIMVRQFLIQRYGGQGLRKSLFQQMGGGRLCVTHPLPIFWQTVLGESGIKVNRWMASFRWVMEIFFRYLHGAGVIVQLCVGGLLAGFSQSPRLGQHARFHGLHSRNIPQSEVSGDRYDICSWYAGWSGRDPKIDTILHNVTGMHHVKTGGLTVRFSPDSDMFLSSLRDTVRFIRWAVPSLILTLLGMLCGRWWNVLMLAEAARAAAVTCAPKETLAVDNMFHFSRAVYRPMWTYVAEMKGSRIICYFYSTYAQPRLSEDVKSQSFEWGPSTWPLFLVWNTFQAEVLKRDLESEVLIDVVGPIYFSDLVAEAPVLPDHAVAVFDIQPHRKSTRFGVSTLYEYYYGHPDVHSRFIEDIYAAIRIAGLSMALKAKRDIVTNGDRRYGTHVKRLAKEDDVVIVPPELAAPRLMNKCIGAISSPFTSAALFFSDHGYPSVYYDPLGILFKDDSAACGIPVLNTKSELQVWLNNLYHAEIDRGSEDVTCKKL